MRPEYLEDPDDERDTDSRRCNPELLLEFVLDCLRTNGKMPTLYEVKQRFGGILGPMLDAWELKRQRRWPQAPRTRGMR